MPDLGLSMKGGSLQHLPPNASSEEQTAVINSILDRLNGSIQSQVLSDGTNKRMIIGYQKDGWGSGKDFGIKISQEGVDVNTATDAQLLFKMDMDTWFFYDPATSKNNMQIGKLPDGTYGFVSVKSGSNVQDAY
jgi:hypothetical protein